MASRKTKERKTAKVGPVYIVKPAFRHGGLDYLHISLIAFAVIMIALAFALSSFKTTLICDYGAVNSTCITPGHNSTQVLGAAERILASYSTLNTTLSLLPYYALVNRSTVAYLSNTSDWIVVVPYINPFTNETLNFSMLIRDSNLSLIMPFQQSIAPLSYSNNRVIALGTISLYGRTDCASSTPIPVYSITDPYSPGALQSILKATNTSKKYDGKVNMTYYFIFTGNSAQLYHTYGVNQTQLIGAYLACATEQKKLGAFVSNLSTAFQGYPLSALTLSQVAASSYLNTSILTTCLKTIYLPLEYQAKFAAFYNITQTPTFIINCRYQAIPQTLDEAINYSLTRTAK